MKTHYLKSILMFALGGILTSAAGNLVGVNPSENKVGIEGRKCESQDFAGLENEEVKPTLTHDAPVQIATHQKAICSIYSGANVKLGNPVRIDSARIFVEEYQLWQRMLPRTFTFTLADSLIKFDPVHVSKKDAHVIDSLGKKYNEYCNSKPDSNEHRSISDFSGLPYSKDSTLARSYYIPREDFEAILCNYPKAKGIRAHMALTSAKVSDEGKVNSHVFLAPAFNPEEDIIENMTHVYDLTMPCPSTCPPPDKSLFGTTLPVKKN